MRRLAGRALERVWKPYGGLLVTLGGALVTEAFAHVIGVPPLVSVSLLLILLAAVAYAALQGGLAWGAASAALLGAYTLHYLSPHGMLVDPKPNVWQGGITMTVIGLGIALPMALLKRREDRLRHALQRQNRDLEERNRELTDAIAALEAFGYVVSHDLKEPVRAIENYLEAAADEYGTPEGRAFLQTARDANQRLTRMLQGLLAYSRASAGTPTLRALDVGDVLRGEACRAQYEEVLRERRGALDVEPGLSPVLGDEIVLSQLLGNVVLNALRHNPRERPTVRVRAEAPTGEGRAHLVVEDDGPGFPEDVLARFRGLSGRRPATVKGGFGLVIGHLAAQRMGGRMWLENGPRGGVVHVELAAAPPGDEGAKVQIQARA